jgi:hypothetical protein
MKTYLLIASVVLNMVLLVLYVNSGSTEIALIQKLERGLDLNDEQRRKLQEAITYYEGATNNTKETLQLTRTRTLQVLYQNPPDHVKAAMLGNSTGPYYIQLEQHLIDLYLQLWEIVPQDQHRDLEKVFTRIFGNVPQS